MQDAKEIVHHFAWRAVESREHGKRHRKRILRILSNFSAGRWQKRKVRLLSTQLIVMQCESSCAHKYDSDVEILLNAKVETCRNPIYQNFKEACKVCDKFCSR